MKKCTGNGLHPGDVIKYDGDWCPMCRMALVMQQKDRTIFILEKCLKHNQVVKPSRRLPEDAKKSDYQEILRDVFGDQIVFNEEP